MSNFLKSIDFYPKLNDRYQVKTYGGALISIVSLTLIVALILSQLAIYLNPPSSHHLLVDSQRLEKINIHFDVTFYHLPCSLLSLDAMDVSGSHQLDVSHHIKKKPLDRFGHEVGGEIDHHMSETTKTEGAEGASTESKEAKPDPTKAPNYCGSCFGAELSPGQCCNTCETLRNAYRVRGWSMASLSGSEQCIAAGEHPSNFMQELEHGDGCRIYGRISVNKVAGNVHFAPGKSFNHMNAHIHDMANIPPNKFNMSHAVHSLSFGTHFPGRVDPMDGIVKIADQPEMGGMYMYYIKVVPTQYASTSALTSSSSLMKTNQFSVTEHFRRFAPEVPGASLPGVFFFYELSPIMVRVEEGRPSLSHFLTQLCAIIGGVFTVAGFIDKIVYSSTRKVVKKNPIQNKQF